MHNAVRHEVCIISTARLRSACGLQSTGQLLLSYRARRCWPEPEQRRYGNADRRARFTKHADYYHAHPEAHLVSPKQFVVGDALDSVVRVQKLDNAMIPNILAVLAGVFPAVRFANRQETHPTRQCGTGDGCALVEESKWSACRHHGRAGG